MRSFVLRHIIVISCAVVLIGFAGTLLIKSLTKDPLSELTTTTIQTGKVEQIVSISGVTKSTNTAELAFPTTGVISSIPVKEGDLVEAGTILATLGNGQLVAALARAKANVSKAEAELAELINGETKEAKAVTTANISALEAEVERAITAGTLSIDNARETLYSDDLAAKTTNSREDAPAPTISGTYHCKDSGTYTLSIYSSGGASGYSMKVSGLEDGIYEVGVNQPLPFGTCGLYAQFSSDGRYQNSVWHIAIPNTSSASYVANKNALASAEQTATDSIAAAKDNLTLAKSQQALENASARPESIIAARAKVAEALANLASAEADLKDTSIVAPFAGTVTDISVLVGEVAPSAPVITLLATDTIELSARVPEIDITKIKFGQKARVRFDAARDTEQEAHITYIAALPTEVDGVSYFEVKLSLNEKPEWLRGGLNADVDIITDSRDNVTRVPSRYVTTDENNVSSIRTLNNNTLSTTTIEVLFRGNDGFIAISTVPTGTVIVAP